MKKYIELYLEEMANTKSTATIRGVRSSLNSFSSYVDVEEPIEVLVKDVVRFRNTLFETKKAGTVNTMLKRVKKFFSWCVEKELLDVSPAEEVKLLTEAEPLPKWLTEEQEDLLIRAMKRKFLGEGVKKKKYREYAIIMLMLKAGLRIGEVVGLRWDEVFIHDKKGQMRIRGKNNQERFVPLIPDMVEILTKYKKECGTKGEYVFYSQMSDTITTRMVQGIVSEFVGVSSKGVVIDELHPHILRHTFAHNLANGQMQLESVARLLGHMKRDGSPNIQQTARYTKASSSEIANDMEKILGI